MTEQETIQPSPSAARERAVRLAILPEILDLDIAAQALGVTPNGVRRMIVRGEIPAAKIGRRWLIRRVALLAAIQDRETVAVNGRSSQQ